MAGVIVRPMAPALWWMLAVRLRFNCLLRNYTLTIIVSFSAIFVVISYSLSSSV